MHTGSYVPDSLYLLDFILHCAASMALAQGPLHMGTTSTYCELFGCNDVGCVELQKKMMKKMMKKKMKKTHK